MKDLKPSCDVLLEFDMVDVQHKLGHHCRGRGEHLQQTNQNKASTVLTVPVLVHRALFRVLNRFMQIRNYLFSKSNFVGSNIFCNLLFVGCNSKPSECPNECRPNI